MKINGITLLLIKAAEKGIVNSKGPLYAFAVFTRDFLKVRRNETNNIESHCVLVN